jgi:acyl carrier protein
MNYVDTVTNAAKVLNLLDSGGNLVVLDSMGLIALITELEYMTRITIPPDAIRAEVFESVASIASLLTTLAPEPTSD